MMSGLVTFYKSCLNLIDDKEAIKSILKGEKVDETAIFSLIQDCEAVSIKTPQDILFFYKKLLTLILILSFSDPQNSAHFLHAKNLLKKGSREGYWNSFQLPMAYAALSSYLMTKTYEKLDVKQLEKGGVLLESGNYILDGNVIKPIESAQLALIWLYLGWASQDEELLSAGLKLAQFCMNFCDKEGHPFQGLWTRESEYDPFILYSSLFLLFSVASHLSLSSKMNVMKEVLFEKLVSYQQSCLKYLHTGFSSKAVAQCDELKTNEKFAWRALKEENFDQVDPLTLLLAMKFQKLIEENISCPEIDGDLMFYDTDSSLGFMRYDYQALSLAYSVCGVNTGLGTIHKKGIHIVSFGPHFYPLADSNCFGIYRTSNGSREGFKDLTMQREEERCQFKGWSRLISPLPSHLSKQNFSNLHPGEQWLFFDIRAEKESLQLDVRLDKCFQKFPLFFVFFISAEKASVKGEEALMPGSLERYQGKTSSLIFENQGEKVLMQPEFEGEMQLIPLEGKKHFWSADFLIAFPLTKKLKVYSWKL